MIIDNVHNVWNNLNNMKKKFFFTVLFHMFYLSSCQNQDFTYKTPPADLLIYKSYVPVNNKNAIDLTQFLSKKIKISNYDFTDDLQQLISKYKNVILPPYTMLINDKGLSIPKGARIYFLKETVIKMKPTAATHFDMLKVYDVSDVQIYNAQLVGDRKRHTGTTGEWAAGIGIRNSTNVIIRYGKISDTWGDGIFIGSENGGVSTDIQVLDLNIDNARRNGISLTSGNNILIQNITISNTNGTMPMCGVDIEPSLPQEELISIKFKNIVTFNNLNGGFNVNTNMFSSDEKNYNKKVSITIEKHKDYSSQTSFGYSIDADNRKYKPSGYILYKDGVSSNPKNLVYWKTPQPKNIKVSVENFTIFKENSKKILHDENF